MKNSLLENDINQSNYDDYIEKVLNIYRLSNKENSILFDIKIDNLKCFCKLSIIGIDGTSKEFNDVTFDFDTDFFKDFICNLVVKFNNDVRVKVKDIVNLDDNSLVTYRMITENNDLFSIDGLSKDDALKLKELCSDEFQSESKGINRIGNNGFANVKMFLFMIAMLVVSFMAIVYFVD